MKQQANLRYVYKINSSRLRKAKWSLNLSIEEAIENKELISIADSQALRFIREINEKNQCNHVNPDEEAKNIKNKIKNFKTMTRSFDTKKTIKDLYNSLYGHLFVKEYVNIVVDNNKDFDRMNSKKGFYINGVKFKRLLATTGGAKKSTVVYVSEDVYDELVKKIDNGRRLDLPLVPNKLEAYKSLVCSASQPVSDPEGILVINDCETTFKTSVIEIDDTKSDYPVVRQVQDYEITLNDSDGYGLISPTQSQKWSHELGEHYIPAGFCIRNSFCKGMLFTFDFLKFANEVAKDYKVIDAWGQERDIRKVSVVLTTSMLKLWNFYDSLEHYLECCKENGYSFSVTKMTPKTLENERNLNYQFIQSLHLTDEDIDKLMSPTVDEIRDVLGGDWRKSILFLKGIHLNELSFKTESFDYIKALMINRDIIHDPFIRKKIHNMIRKRINEAKIGVLKVKGNFSTISGDPYSLCQSMFELPVTGLLRAGEFYSQYWNDKGVSKVACFRAPMTCHNNIRILHLKNTEQMQEWYKYMNTVTIFNSWDTTSHALNGADRDGDTVLTTDNEIILKSIKELDAIVCIQKTAQKKLVEENDLIQANKNSFGDEIGTTTNKITSMFDVMAQFSVGSPEYEELQYRIQCGQNYQQNAIDKTKGIESKSMPKEWYDYWSNLNLEPDKKEFNLRILADKKPYFFTYIYPSLRKLYKNHINSYEDSCWENFRCSFDELLTKENKTNEEAMFIEDYYKRMPVSINPSVMNKICWKVERIFDGISLANRDGVTFDYNVMKTDVKYSKAKFLKIKELFHSYKTKVQDYSLAAKSERIDKEERKKTRQILKESFKIKAQKICPDPKELCNIVLDLCYTNDQHSKQFVWDICGEQIVKNLLSKSGYKIAYPVQDERGDIEFNGERFSVFETTIDLEEINEFSFE